MQVISINQQTKVDSVSRSQPKDTTSSNGQGRFVPRLGASAIIGNVETYAYSCVPSMIIYISPCFRMERGENERPSSSESAPKDGGGA